MRPGAGWIIPAQRLAGRNNLSGHLSLGWALAVARSQAEPLTFTQRRRAVIWNASTWTFPKRDVDVLTQWALEGRGIINKPSFGVIKLERRAVV